MEKFSLKIKEFIDKKSRLLKIARIEHVYIVDKMINDIMEKWNKIVCLKH